MQLSVSDVAAHLAVPEATVYEWIEQGVIPFSMVNGQHRLSSADVLEWAVARGHRLSGDLIKRPQGTSGATLLAQALECGGVHRLAGPHDRESLLRALVEGSGGLDEGDQALLLELLKASEALGPTGLGGGIAIPHVRTPIVVNGAPASLSAWYLDVPVDYFGAADGTPVDTVFFLVTPTPRVHLHLVSQLMTALHDEEFRAAVRDRAPLDRLVAGALRVLAVAEGLAAARAASRGGR
jgi:PTS system nitrogen regulatory IIA component